MTISSSDSGNLNEADLAQILAPSLVAGSNTLASLEEKSYDRAKLDSDIKHLNVELETKQTQLKSLKNDIFGRLCFSWLIFGFVIIWITAVLLVTILVGAGVMKLEPSILLMLLGTTTANVLGLFTIVAKYLFPDPNKNK